MTPYPKLQLSRLREIGWKFWDPIGLANDDGTYGQDCADEYDSYLLHVADLISRGGSTDEATIYLNEVASEHMGLSLVDADAAAAVSQAIAEYLATLADAPKTAR